MLQATIYTYSEGSRNPMYFGHCNLFAPELTPKIARDILQANGIYTGAVLRYEPARNEHGYEYMKPVLGYRVYTSGRTRKLYFS